MAKLACFVVPHGRNETRSSRRCDGRYANDATSHHSRSMSGCAACSEAITATMAYLGTSSRWRVTTTKYGSPGIARFNGEASVRGGLANDGKLLKLDTRFRLRASHTLPLRRASLPRRPEVGARCGKSARRVLSGGRPERAVPTGTQ